MLALIKRELDDLTVFVSIIIIMILMLIAFNILLAYSRGGVISSTPDISIDEYIYITLITTAGLPILMLAFGASQMYFDRSSGASTFLVCLAATRSRVILAKMIAGTGIILFLVGALALTQAVLLMVLPKSAPIASGLLVKMHLVTILLSMSFYSMGLLVGGTVHRIWAVVLALLLAAPLAAVVIIKGFGVQSCVILFLFTAGSLTRVWQKFMTGPL